MTFFQITAPADPSFETRIVDLELLGQLHGRLVRHEVPVVITPIVPAYRIALTRLDADGTWASETLLGYDLDDDNWLRQIGGPGYAFGVRVPAGRALMVLAEAACSMMVSQSDIARAVVTTPAGTEEIDRESARFLAHAADVAARADDEDYE